MHIHFIAIGGSAMHNLAIALHKKGYFVTGSDDEIFEPSKSRLEKYNLLPAVEGWQPQLISEKIDVIILGMHARIDNPELLRAQQLGLKIYSYPEYLFEQTKNKTRVVIGGSHGKTTCTSMIMHVLKYHNVDFDYMVGANLEGFETMVGLNQTSKIAIFEGDEYLSSPIDLKPKFHHYKPHVAMLTGVAWDHINVFPTFDGYVEQFRIFANMIEKNGSLIYFEGDKYLNNIVSTLKNNINILPYNTPKYALEENKTSLLLHNKKINLRIFGEHNLQNIAGAKLVCAEIGINEDEFLKAISSFSGSARRLEIIGENDHTTVFYDFAHSPSKLKATTQAVKDQFVNRKLIAVMELHTFSSLKADFLPQYNNSMKAADKAMVYFNPKTIEHKKLEQIFPSQVSAAFGNCVEVYTDSNELFKMLSEENWVDKNLLIMTSGNFSGKDIKAFGKAIVDKY